MSFAVWSRQGGTCTQSDAYALIINKYSTINFLSYLIFTGPNPFDMRKKLEKEKVNLHVVDKRFISHGESNIMHVMDVNVHLHLLLSTMWIGLTLTFICNQLSNPPICFISLPLFYLQFPPLLLSSHSCPRHIYEISHINDTHAFTTVPITKKGGN